ncbi:MAG: hypothetical protein E6K72_03800 [Candidatus Eisenbacteria bacterium]|uniref:HupE/UreJ family protein n=1 Tax=Eiseniibacteriota bacterium TaxID=2212470 RepID=A0A538T104_UNCEI|nr:MAG: hypothetical protein E6K72_03800 [Candidatus Eisenbacteria bacterium]
MRRAALAVVLATFLLPARADAQLVTTGLGPVYDGIGHLLTTPEDLVPALALALYAGLRGPRAGRRALFLLPPAWFLGGLVGLRSPMTIAFPLAAISFLAGADSGVRGLIGIAVALFVVVALAAALVVALERPWKRIAARVAGSWIAAVGLLLLGWRLRGAR